MLLMESINELWKKYTTLQVISIHLSLLIAVMLFVSSEMSTKSELK